MAIKTSDYDYGPGGSRLQGDTYICEFLSMHYFIPESIVHIPRSCNRCAHELVRSGTGSTDLFGVIPSQVLYALR